MDHALAVENGRVLGLSFEAPTSLQSLFETRLHLSTADKIVLVNGTYVRPSYTVKDGDLVQVLRMMEGG
jgi:sulfur carrier protein ThiS